MTWVERATTVITNLRGEQPTPRQVELLCGAVWTATRSDQPATAEQRAQYTVQVVAQFLNQEIDKGAARQGVLELQRQLQAASRGETNED